jgi:hypothetical protein
MTTTQIIEKHNKIAFTKQRKGGITMYGADAPSAPPGYGPACDTDNLL